MDPALSALVRQSLTAAADAMAGDSPVYSALCRGLAAGPSPAAYEIFARYARIISAFNTDVESLLSGLHALALQGQAGEVARFFPSCGGAFAPGQEAELLAAAERDLAAGRDEILDFMLSREPAVDDPQTAVPLLLGALAAADQFGGGLSLVQLGCGGGLDLLFDRFAYRLAGVPGGVLGPAEAPVALSAEIADKDGAVARLVSRPMPAVGDRAGLGDPVRDLTEPQELAAVAAYLPPDRLERRARLIGAAAVLEANGPLDLRRGNPAFDLAPLLVEAYNRMAPGNTLLLFHTLQWHALGDDERRRAALAVQQLAAQLQPKKPLAWLQTEPAAPGGSVIELKLNTFGWTHMEDRSVRRLAEANPEFTQVRWIE